MLIANLQDLFGSQNLNLEPLLDPFELDSSPGWEDGSCLSFRTLLEAAYRVAAKVIDCTGQRVGLMLEKAAVIMACFFCLLN